jgi:hypothetical protein|tara:strand:- start:212 stop:382 length:171 start_codon:yes stop_codon:yes gene_type:complete
MDAELKGRVDELSTVKDNLLAQLQNVIGRIDEIKELQSNGYYLAKRKEAKKSKSKR